MRVRLAVTSRQAEQLALNNVAKPQGWEFFYGTQAEELAVYNPDFLYVHGLFVNDYGAWNLYRHMMGDIPRVVIRFTGTDVLQLTEFVKTGCTAIIDWLKTDRFVLIPPSKEVGKELEALGLKLTAPLNTPAQRVFDPIPRPEKFTVGVYLPPHRQEFFNIPLLKGALGKMKDYKAIFYHFLPLIEEFDFDGPHEKRFALKREEYEQTLADCSCLIRLPVHDANSISTAEFLMADRPVVSLQDFPEWPAMANKKMSEQELADIISAVRDAPPVPKATQKYAREAYDPKLWGARLQERVQATWPKFKL